MLNLVAALAQTIPHQPVTPPTRDFGSSSTQLIVDWSNLTAQLTGGAAITSYHLQYDGSSNGAIWTDLVGLTTQSLATTFTLSSPITAGAVY